MGRKENPDTRQKAAKVLDLMCEELMSTTRAAEQVGIKLGTFFDLVERDPAFSEEYTRARTVLLHGYAAQTIEIADTPVEGVTVTTKADGGVEEKRGDMIEHRRLQIETRKWMLARLMRGFGDKQQIEHSGSVSIADTLRAAREKRRGEG